MIACDTFFRKNFMMIMMTIDQAYLNVLLEFLALYKLYCITLHFN